ncbi:tandem-95 repeat protein, partial [Chitinophaga silvisoli]
MKNIFLLSFGFLLCSLISFGQMPTSPCSPSGGKKADILGVEAKYRAPGGTAPVFTIPAGTSSINVYVSSETGITSGGDNVQGDEDFINISAVIDIAGGTSSGYVNVAKNTNTDGSGTNVYGWQKVALGAYIPTASKVGDATPDLNNVNFTISGNTLTITESNTTTHSSYYVEYASPYNNSLTPLDPQVKALLHGTATANTDLVIPIPTGTNIISIMGKGTNTSYADLNTSAGTEEGYSNMRFTIDLDAGMTDGVMTLANGGAVARRSTYVINNLSSASTMSFLSSAAITGDYSGKLTSTGAVGVSNPQIYVSGTNLVIRRDANYARDFDDAYVVEFFKRVGQGMSAEFFNSDFAFIAKGTSSASGVAKTFTIPLGTTTMYLNETGNACNTVNESNENSLAAYAYIDLNTGTATGYFYQQVGLDGTARRDDNFAFKGLPLDGTSARNHTNTVGYKGAYGYDISFQLSADKTTLTVINKTGLANPDYQILESMDYYGARPDIAFNSTNISFAKGSSCNIVRASVEVCNPGAGNATAGMPISLYHGDPTTDPAAILLYTGTFNQAILQGECKTFTYDMDLSAFDNLDFDVTLIINDNGSFVSGGIGHAVGTPFTLSSLANQNTGYKECYFDNNLITKTMNVNNCPKANLDPDNSSGATGKYNYLNYFNAGSSGAKITDTDLSIVDYDGDNMVKAVITLTNVLDAGSEGLYINGTLPAGITATGSGTSTITLTGAASQASYIAALKLIEYRNAKSAPNTTNRIITTTLNDGTETGPASTTTIVITTDPRINVTGNGTLINDNSGTVSTVDGTDFGTVTTGTVVHTFVINNVGTGIINLTGTPMVAISGDAGFTVSAQPTVSSVTAGGNTSFTLTFNTASHTVGTYVAVVRILNNDADTGRANYSYTVMATVNNLPVVNNSTVSGLEDNTLTFAATDFTSQYSDADGTALSKIRIVTLPLNGSFRLNGVVITAGQEILASQLANITFIPTANWNGTTSFDWRASDGTSYSTAAAKMTIVITAVNDAPVITVPTSIAVTEDVPASLKDISFADVDAGMGSVTVTFSVPDGYVSAVSGSGVTVSGTGSALVLNGTLTDINAFLVANKVTYSSSQNPPATVTLTVNINDNGNTGTGGAKQDTKTVVLGITAVNDAPVALDDAYTVVEDTPYSGNVLSNDTDVEGNTLSASVLAGPVHGTVVLNANGSFTYTPALNYNGLDSLKYRVCDNGTPSMCDTGTVIFTVTPVNDAPVAVDDAYTVVEDTPYSGNVLSNDSDVEGNTLSASMLTGPVHGTVVLSANGSFTYTPALNYNGLDSLKYRVCDNGTPSMCDTGTVIFTVTPVNDAPVAVDDAVTVTEDTPTDFTVLTNDTDVEGNALTATVITGPVNGTVIQNPDGSFKYTPNTNFNGLDSLKYRVCDNGTPSMCDTGTVIFTVTPVNDAPVAIDDAITVLEDTPTDFTVLTNDTDVEGDALTATVITGPVNGTITQNPDGSFKYTPNGNYNGLDSIKYQVCDNGTPSMCDTGMVIFTVSPVNDAPVAVNDAVTVTEDTPTDFTVLTNDTDVEGDALTATVITAPLNGVVTQNPDGSFKYTPNGNYNGLDSIKYQVCDNGTPSMCDTATVIFTVTLVNDAPVAVNDAVTVIEDTPTDFTVLTNDADVEGDALTATVITGPVNGVVTQNPDGSFKYSPNANYNGLDSLKYQVCDNGTPSMCDTATVIFTVTPVNDAPVAVNDAVTVTEDTPTDFTVLTNDTDVEGDVLTATVITAPVNGTVTQNPDGSFKYSPNANYNGLDSLKYQVCDNGTPSMCDTGTVIFTVTPVNDAPVAVNDAVTVTEDTPTDFTVLTNDTDVEGDALTATVITAPLNGVVTQNPDGSFKYTPNGNYNGLDSIKYQVCDNGTPSMCDTGTVIFTVSPVNDAPVAVNDAVTVTEDTPTDFTVLTNDTDVEGDALTATVIIAPINGVVTQNPDGSFNYTPNTNYNGLDSIKYQVCDNGTPSMCDTGTVIFTVSPVNDAPVAVNDAVTVTEDTPTDFTVLTNDTDVEGDALTATVITAPVNGTVTQNPDGSFKYSPNANYNGLDSLKYQVCDNGTPSMCDTATVIFTVTPVNDAPVAVNDAVTVTEDTPADFAVLTNDTDVEGDALTATVITAPVNGTVTQNPDGSFKYSPNANYNGLDSLKYQVCDNGTPSMCDTGTVIFTVSPVNDAPVAVNDAVTVTEDTPTDFTVLTNDTDVEGDVLTATVITAPVNGTVAQNPDGSFKYTPNANYNGLDSIKYQVCDNGTPSMCDTATVIFTVTTVNDAPVAVNDAVTVTEDTPTDFTVLTNDTDVEGDVLTATVITAPVNGTVTQNPDGSFKYSPNANYNGLDSLKYQVCDNGTPSMCDTATVIFTVTAVNDAPVAVNDAVTVIEDTPIDFTVLTN